VKSNKEIMEIYSEKWVAFVKQPGPLKKIAS
jgi:hypothetical protein